MVVDDDDGGDDDDNDDDDDDHEDANRKAMNGVRTKAEWLRADAHTLFSTEVECWWIISDDLDHHQDEIDVL